MIPKLLKWQNDYLLNQLLKKGTIVLLFRVLGLFSGLIFTVLVAKSYGPEVLGVVALILSLSSILSLISKVGMDMTFLNFAAHLKNRIQLNKLFWKILFILIVFGSIFTILLWLYVENFYFPFFSGPNANFYALATVFSILPTSILMLLSEWFRAKQKMAEYAFFSAGASPLFACLLFLVFNSYFGNEKFVILFRIIPTFFFIPIIFFILALRYRIFKLSKANSKKKLPSTSQILKYGSAISVSNSVGLIMQHSGIIFLGFYTSESDVGIYKAVISFSLLINLVLVAVSNISAPLYSEAFVANNISKIEEISRKSVKLIFWCTLPLIFCYLLFPKTILKTVDPSFQSGWVALLILALGQFFNAICGSVGVILNMTNKAKVRTRTSLISGIINLVLSLVLIPVYGLEGAAWAFTISGSIWNILGIFYIKKYYNFSSLYFPLLVR